MHPHPTPRRASRALIATALLAVAPLAVALLVTSCGPAPSRGAPTAIPTPTATALYASDEEALAAAEEVYREYLDVVYRVLVEDAPLDDFTDVVSGDMLDLEIAAATRFREDGGRAEGRSELRYVELVDAKISEDHADLVTLVCEDISNVHLFDSSGTSLVPEDRSDFALSEVTFETVGDALLITSLTLQDKAC